MSLTPFDGLTPSRFLWVSTHGSLTGDGSSAHPFLTLQQAVNVATPGTAIMVKAGTYVGNTLIQKWISGTSHAPIWIESADGPQAAHLIGASQGAAVIGGGGVSNIIVQGFWVSGGRNGIQFSQDGFTYTKMINNIVVEGNLIDGALQDGIKANGGFNVYVLNNTITNGEGDQGIDFLAINNSLIAGNEIARITGSSAIYAKGGSTNDVIANNYIHDVVGDGIGMGDHMGSIPWMPGFTGYEVRNLLVIGNRVEVVGGRALAAVGAVQSDAIDNYLSNTGVDHVVNVSADTLPSGPVLWSRDLTISDNIFDTAYKQLWVDPGNNHDLVFSGNVATGHSTVGDDSANYIVAGKGSQILWGEGGADTLMGGGGTDTFIYAPGDGGDQILDFKRGVDVLDLRPISWEYHDLTVSFTDTRAGLEVFANYDSTHELLATLEGVHGPGLIQGLEYLV
jgi:Ca2+-binding RTX toxin-like protein